ncbi:MAG: glycosyltransferase, partial [Pseudonocardiales bacterium]|nr:glycosyltransferase [Pseudonocardiales bacterium]
PTRGPTGRPAGLQVGPQAGQPVAQPTAQVALPRGPAGPATEAPTLRVALAERVGTPETVRPGLTSFTVATLVALAVSAWAWLSRSPDTGTLAGITTVLWTLPAVQVLVGLYGVLRTRRRLAGPDGTAPSTSVADASPSDELIVVVPTIGRLDTVQALERVVPSLCRYLPVFFPRLRVDVVVEEGCEAAERIARLGARFAAVRVLTVPRAYRTRHGTKFKARANEYALQVRRGAGEDRDDVWILHMDDDTAVGPDTAREIARFVVRQRHKKPEDRMHVAQGVLTYPAENAVSRVLWLADSVRPAADVSLFAATTGTGYPVAGMHGELLMVRSSVESRIGWDFGPHALVEDAEFALRLARLHPRSTDWFPGRSYGAVPVGVADFVTQRERWSWGLMQLAFRSGIPLRLRVLLVVNVLVWATAPIQHVGVVLAVGLLLGDTNTLPVTAVVLPLWAMNVGFQVWSYWEGYRMNVSAGAGPRPRFERLLLLALIPVFSLWEAAGVTRGLVRAVRGGASTFTVIAKPL